jgi:hypothetical protein
VGEQETLKDAADDLFLVVVEARGGFELQAKVLIGKPVTGNPGNLETVRVSPLRRRDLPGDFCTSRIETGRQKGT